MIPGSKQNGPTPRLATAADLGQRRFPRIPSSLPGLVHPAGHCVLHDMPAADIPVDAGILTKITQASKSFPVCSLSDQKALGNCKIKNFIFVGDIPRIAIAGFKEEEKKHVLTAVKGICTLEALSPKKAGNITNSIVTDWVNVVQSAYLSLLVLKAVLSTVITTSALSPSPNCPHPRSCRHRPPRHRCPR